MTLATIKKIGAFELEHGWRRKKKKKRLKQNNNNNNNNNNNKTMMNLCFVITLVYRCQRKLKEKAQN